MEGDLCDLSLPALTSYYALLAKPFHGNDFDLVRVIVALAVACCPYGAPSCEEPECDCGRNKLGPPAWGPGWWEAQGTVSQRLSEAGNTSKPTGLFHGVNLLLIVTPIVLSSHPVLFTHELM